MSHQIQDPVTHRLTCEHHDSDALVVDRLRIDRYSRDLRNLTSAFDRVAWRPESSEAQGDALSHLSKTNPEGIRKLLVQHSKMLMDLDDIKARTAARGVIQETRIVRAL